MSKYNVTHRCGHEVTVELFGKETDRARKIEWLSGQDCPECRKAAQKAAEVAANEKLAALPRNIAATVELVGSEKQIAWANTIRESAVNQINALIEKQKAVAPAENIKIVIDRLGKILDKQTSAAAWIDARNSFSTPEMAVVALTGWEK